SQGAVAFVFPAEGARAEAAALEGGYQAAAGKRGKLAVLEGLRIFRPRELQESRHEIDDVARFSAELSPRTNTRRPGGDQRRRDAALMNPHLVFAEGGVGGVRPADFETAVRFARAGFATRLVAAGRVRPGIEELRAGTVIREKEDERILFRTD